MTCLVIIVSMLVTGCEPKEEVAPEEVSLKACGTCGTFPVCCSASSDPDGDGWGWEENASCVINGSAAQRQQCSGGISTGCTGTNINPFAQVNGGAWQNVAAVTVSAGGSVRFGPQPASGGSWRWSGPNGFSSTSREITITNVQSVRAGNYVATYTNTSNCQSTRTFSITVSGGGNGNCGTSTVTSGSYFLMNNIWGSGAGSQCIWFTSINSWGTNASHSGSGIKSYPALVRGCHWGGCSPNSGLPRQISALSSSLSTSWTQTNNFTAGNAAYDIWFDNSSNPGNRAAQYELMVWLNWRNQEPIAQSYDSQGRAIPFASNVNVGGRVFNVYRRDNVFSFRLVTQSNSISFNIKQLADYCVARGWMSSSAYMVSIQAGWEIIQGGQASTSAYSVSGL